MLAISCAWSSSLDHKMTGFFSSFSSNLNINLLRDLPWILYLRHYCPWYSSFQHIVNSFLALFTICTGLFACFFLAWLFPIDCKVYKGWNSLVSHGVPSTRNSSTWYIRNTIFVTTRTYIFITCDSLWYFPFYYVLLCFMFLKSYLWPNKFHNSLKGPNVSSENIMIMQAIEKKFNILDSFGWWNYVKSFWFNWIRLQIWQTFN